MEIYLLIFSLPFMLIPLRKFKKETYIYLIAFAWVLFAGLRSKIGGADYFTYFLYYKNPFNIIGIKKLDYEPLFYLLVQTLRFLKVSFNGFLSIVSIFIILPPLLIVDKHTDGNPIAFYILGTELLFFNSFVILRQGIAIGFIFLAIDALYEQKLLKFTLLVIVATGFHYSAIIFLIIIIFNKRLTPFFRVGLFLLSVLIAALIEIILHLDKNLFTRYEILGRFLHYLPDPEPLNILNYFEVGTVLFLFLRYNITEQFNKILFINSYFIFLCFNVLSFYHAIFMRLGRFFEIGLIFLLPSIINKAWERSRREGALISLGLFIYTSAKFIRWLYINAYGPGGFLPYRWILGG